MTRKIALEEHFLVEGFASMGRTEGSGPAAAFRRQAAERLPEIDALRLEAMDKAGIDRAVLSLFQPGIQGERDTATAIRKAKAVNDMLAERIAKHPARFRGFAAVPMQDPAKPVTNSSAR
jgi:2,3-dihydroxybenzoate decarboxylase